MDLNNPPKYIDRQCLGDCHRYKRLMKVGSEHATYTTYTGYCLDCCISFEIVIRPKTVDVTDMDLQFKIDLQYKQLVKDLDALGFPELADKVNIKLKQARLIE